MWKRGRMEEPRGPQRKQDFQTDHTELCFVSLLSQCVLLGNKENVMLRQNSKFKKRNRRPLQISFPRHPLDLENQISASGANSSIYVTCGFWYKWTARSSIVILLIFLFYSVHTCPSGSLQFFPSHRRMCYWSTGTSILFYVGSGWAKLKPSLSRELRTKVFVWLFLKAFSAIGPVPERPISTNPGLQFCSTFCIYLPLHCLE